MRFPRMLTMGGCALLMLASAGIAQDGKQAERRRGGGRDDGALKVGDVAPLFTLKSLDGKKETDLKGFRGKKPVILFFGSYT